MRSVSPRRETAFFSRALLLAAVASAVGACDHDGLKGSGSLKTDTRAVTGFTEIALATMGDVSLSQTGADSLTVEAEDNLLPHLTSTVSGGRLTLATDAPLHPTKPVHYTVTVKDLTAIEVSGAGDVKGTNLNASTLKIRISGAGDVTLSGQAESQDVTLAGAGNYDAAKLTTKTAKVLVSGAGDAVINATDAVDAKVSGAGDIEYVGGPKVTQVVSGAGEIRKKL